MQGWFGEFGLASLLIDDAFWFWRGLVMESRNADGTGVVLVSWCVSL